VFDGNSIGAGSDPRARKTTPRGIQPVIKKTSTMVRQLTPTRTRPAQLPGQTARTGRVITSRASTP
jgi:hypothetical protein